MAYSVRFQTEEKYRHVRYGQGTIYSSGCGPASLCNALRAAGIANVSVETMCKLATECGARVEGGTLENVLLKAAAQKYNFKWSTTSYNDALMKHLKNGGVAILHAGSAYPLFSSGGHFVAAVGASGQDVIVLDSYWYSGKYTSTSLRANNVRVLDKGIVKTNIKQCGKATIDRAPSYYLITKVIPKIKTTEDVNARLEAGKDSKAIGRIQKGSSLRKVDETDNWVQCYVWIPRKNCKISGNTATTIAESQARSRNSKTSKRVGTIKDNVKIKANRKTKNWIKVPVWIAKKYCTKG